jgi:hypothetical protein
MEFTDVYYNAKTNTMVLVKKCSAWKDGYKFYTFMKGYTLLPNSKTRFANVSYYNTRKNLDGLTYIGKF